ncbi:MAG: glycosyltransferase family 2 protein [Simkaniaceae bacterium]|nr:glycosyltransferase family 2 protein [Simkaniaceae bacterium]
MNLFYFFLIFLSFPLIFRRYKESEFEDVERLLKSEFLPPVSIIVPMHNEVDEILASITSLSYLSYPHLKVIVVNDGSTDGSLACLNRAFDLRPILIENPLLFKTQPIKQIYASEKWPNLTVVDKVRGGKGDALNAGINLADTPLIMTVDADTSLEKEALLRMVHPFINEKGIGAQGGTLRIVRQRRGGMARYLSGVQEVEYLRAFLYGRLGWNSLGGNLIVSGAFGLFDRSALIEVGGYVVGEVSEDLEVTISLTRFLREKHQKKVVQFIPDSIAWTKGPETLKALSQQRERWHRGLIETVVRHRGVLFNPKYGCTAFIGFPYLIFAELIQPLIEVVVSLSIVGGIFLGYVDLEWLFLLMIATSGIHTLLTLLAILLEMMTFQRLGSRFSLIRLGGMSLLENLGFRQICMVARLYGFYRYARGCKIW